MDLEHERRLTEAEARGISNTKRINELSVQIDAVKSLATSVAVLANKLDTMNDNLTNMSAKVEMLEAEPAKKWRFVVEKTIYIIVAAVLGFLLAQAGLQ